MDYAFSNKISALQPSAIREILKFTSDPEVISFAAGNPAPEAFPVADIEEITARILRESPIEALQYGITEGYAPLREKVADYIRTKHGIGSGGDDIMITAGAQQVMDLASKALLNEGDTVICEAPSFIGSLNCFRSYNARLVGIDVEPDGINTAQLRRALETQPNVKFIYTIPNFQNPSGVTMSLKKRREVYALAKEFSVPIIEDNPYGDLRVAGEHIPAIKSLDDGGLVIYAGSFSKILSPGLRVGFAVAPRPVTAKLTVGKQAADVHTPMLNQMIVNEWMRNYDFEGHIDKIKSIYRKKLDLMCSLIDEYLGDFVTWQKPQGGLFIWCRLPDSVDMQSFCKTAVENKVAVVPGSAFMADESEPTQYIRLNFSTPTDENIERGMKILGGVKRMF